MTLLHGDCLAQLATLPDASIDACVTDPPYGIGFMGKEWDTFDRAKAEQRLAKSKEQREKNRAFYEDNPNPNLRRRQRSPALQSSAIEYDYSLTGLRGFQGWCEEWGREVIRVLKPGGYAVVCGAPRAYHRMASGLEDAGFEIRDCLAWLFGSGFPKSLNLGEGLGTALKPAHEPIVLARKPFKGTVKANVQTHGTGALNIDACRIEAGARPLIIGTPKNGNYVGEFRQGSAHGGNTDLGRWPANVCLDDLAALVLDEQSGELTSGLMLAGQLREGIGYHGGLGDTVRNDTHADSGGASRFYKVCSPDCILCGESTDNRDTMSGCETTSASSAEQRFITIHRITASIALPSAHASLVEQLARRALSAANLCATCATFTALTLVETKHSDTRRPESAAFLASMPDFKSSTLTRSLASFAALWANTDIIPTTGSLSLLFGSVAHAIGSSTRQASHESDSDLPRFLYSAKPSREERDYGCHGLQEKSGGQATQRTDGSAGLNSPRAGSGRTGGSRNFHPTVKPVGLMRWLVRLVTPINGVVLDPFLGSGTTGMAAKYEQRSFIGIEREVEYMAIAERRIRAVAPLFSESA